MKKFIALFFCLVLAASVCAAKKKPAGKTPAEYKVRTEISESYVSDNRIYQVETVAAFDTTYLAYYTFDNFPACDNQGWTSVDKTAQLGDYFHVDDFFAGSGDFDRLYPIEGGQSLWCGLYPNPSGPECSYLELPGYGNLWNQAFCSPCTSTTDTMVTVSYYVQYDCEPGYDETTLEYAGCPGGVTGQYQREHSINGGAGNYDGAGGPVFESINIDVTGQFALRFHFTSDGSWSDQDGQWDTDGAIIIDSLTVTDGFGVLFATEDFEGESVGDNDATDWYSCTPPGYGDLAELVRAFPTTYQNDPVEEDPCTFNFSCMWTFYKGSTADYACNQPNPSPQQLAVPYVNSRDQYVHNEVWSPWIPYTGTGTITNLEFDVYRDMSFSTLIFYTWKISAKNVNVSECPVGWIDRQLVYNGGGKDWFRASHAFGDLLSPGTTHIQIALGVVDLCPIWCPIVGAYYKCHSHAPMFDNVEVYRVALSGPQFFVNDIDMFQDNFSTDGTITGPARADMAQDILPFLSSVILPGDSACITVNDPEVGLGTDSYTGCGPAVYCYISVDPDSVAHTAPEIEAPETRPGCGTRFPYVTSAFSAGRTWYVYRMDSCFTNEGYLAADRYCIDFNDNVFVPGDTCWFFFGAENAIGKRTYYSLPYGYTTSIRLTAGEPDEFTILPIFYDRPYAHDDILYVDGMNFRGAQPFFDTAFQGMNLAERIDRYDIRGPDSRVGNRPGSRVVNVTNQLIGVYRTIIWNTGDMRFGCIGDGITHEKSDDATMLFNFLDQHTETMCGVYFSGDDLADEWSTLTGPGAVSLRTYMDYSVINSSHVAAGAGINPAVVSTPGGTVFDTWQYDSTIVYGGCPTINDFDVLAPAGGSTAEMDYAVFNCFSAPGPRIPSAILAQATTNSAGNTARVLLSGFSYHNIRDIDTDGILDRFRHLRRVLTWMGNSIDMHVSVPPSTRSNSLAQNYPNPFNPVTTINYTIKEKAHVSLKVYNVAGQLVRTLVDEIQSPDVVRPVEWRGRNNNGLQVASGVYFYKLVTKDFTKTKKMVLLK